MNDEAKCRSCGAPLRWLANTNGNLVPLDIEPVEDGNIVILDDGRCKYVPPRETLDMFTTSVRYVSHFVTCPDANKWRKKPANVSER